MSRKTFKKISLSLLSLLAIAACGRNSDDFRRERVLEERAKVEAVAGRYAGLVRDPRDNSPLGRLDVEIQADSKVRTSSDGTRSEEVPVLRLQGTFTSNRSVVIVFEDASYDFETGVMKALLPVQTRAGTKSNLSITGSFAADRKSWDGRFGIDGFPDQAGRVRLERDAVVELPRPLQDGDPQGLRPAFSFEQSYLGQMTIPVLGAHTIGMRLESVSEPGLTELVDYFSPVRAMRVSLVFSRELEVEFPSAQWDRTARVLRATQTISWPGGGAMPVTIECQERAAAEAERFAGVPAFNCLTWLQGETRRHFLSFEPAEETFDGQNLRPLGGVMVGSTTSAPGSSALIPLSITVDQAEPSERADFESIYRLETALRVTIGLSPVTEIVFPTASWNSVARRLVATTTVAYAGKSSALRLECQGAAAELPSVLNCVLRAGVRGDVRTFTVNPAANGVVPSLPTFARRYSAREGTNTIGLEILSPMPTRDNELAEFFEATRFVRASIAFSKDVIMTFPVAEWRLDTGLLSAQVQGSGSGGLFVLRLDCLAQGPAAAQGWNCEYTSTGNGISNRYSFRPTN